MTRHKPHETKLDGPCEKPVSIVIAEPGTNYLLECPRYPIGLKEPVTFVGKTALDICSGCPEIIDNSVQGTVESSVDDSNSDPTMV